MQKKSNLYEYLRRIKLELIVSLKLIATNIYSNLAYKLIFEL